MLPRTPLPFATADLPGVGGVLRQTDDDFRVEETLAYQPSGTGEHVFVHIEKRGLSTAQAADALAHALGVDSRDIGWAGMKDRRAVTRQTLSLPPPCTPEAALALELPGITVLAAARHEHKLRTGHLSGNRFVVRVRELAVDETTGAERALAVLRALGATPGSPNWYGEQRFGRDQANADVGLALVLGTPLPPGVRRPRGRQLRLYVSALQSYLFNEYLRARMDDGLYARALAGDIMQKRGSGGLFACDDTATDQARLDAGEIVPTGPMFGHKFKQPPEGTAAAAREHEILAAHELTPASFARVKKLGLGARRAIAVPLGELHVAIVGERAIELGFALPAGAYATAVLREVVKAPTEQS